MTGRANHATASLALQVVRRHDGNRYAACQQKLGRHLRGPSLARKALNFSKATVRHIKDGRRKLSSEQRAARLAVCKTCGFCDTDRMVCRHQRCGCFLETKAGWASEDCPLGKWPNESDPPVAKPKQDAARANVAKHKATDEPFLTIGMATYDDFDGVYYSVQALRAFHAELMPQVGIVVVDNNPGSKQGEATNAFIEGACRSIARYVPYTERRGSCLLHRRPTHAARCVGMPLCRAVAHRSVPFREAIQSLSLPVVLRRLGVGFHQFGRDQLSRLFRSYSHRK